MIKENLAKNTNEKEHKSSVQVSKLINYIFIVTYLHLNRKENLKILYIFLISFI